MKRLKNLCAKQNLAIFTCVKQKRKRKDQCDEYIHLAVTPTIRMFRQEIHLIDFFNSHYFYPLPQTDKTEMDCEYLGVPSSANYNCDRRAEKFSRHKSLTRTLECRSFVIHQLLINRDFIYTDHVHDQNTIDDFLTGDHSVCVYNYKFMHNMHALEIEK